MISLNIHPELATEKLFSVLPKRTRDILEQRFGVGKSSRRLTLDAIGKKYGITRERVRQIEADGLIRMRKAPAMAELEGVFSAINSYFSKYGNVVKESTVLSDLTDSPKYHNHVLFLMRLYSPLNRLNEDETLHTRWCANKEADIAVKKILSKTVDQLRSIAKPVSADELHSIANSSAISVIDVQQPNDTINQWVMLSKQIAQNYFDEWGLVEHAAIRPRGVRDLSHLVMERGKEPMHFSDVAKSISDVVGKSVHVQTVHNELIKDPRFVLVGRGLYALKAWGYGEGTVKDVIAGVLKDKGSMTKEKIISLVAAQRFVKPNTIAINLENKKHFKKVGDGKYTIR
jgi:hypothetical protein